jgi:hypothetical protein
MARASESDGATVTSLSYGIATLPEQMHLHAITL